VSDFQTSIAAEKHRLTNQRSELEAQVRDLQAAIASVDHELSAIAAYESARNGKASVKAPRGMKRDTVLAIIKDNAGITRGGIIEKLTAQGQDSPEKGLSNMLTTLKAAGKLKSDDGRYSLAG
jgi:hypothetical protein